MASLKIDSIYFYLLCFFKNLLVLMEVIPKKRINTFMLLVLSKVMHTLKLYLMGILFLFQNVQLEDA